MISQVKQKNEDKDIILLSDHAEENDLLECQENVGQIDFYHYGKNQFKSPGKVKDNQKLAVEKYEDKDIVEMNVNSELSIPGAENINTSYAKELIESDKEYNMQSTVENQKNGGQNEIRMEPNPQDLINGKI